MSPGRGIVVLLAAIVAAAAVWALWPSWERRVLRRADALAAAVERCDAPAVLDLLAEGFELSAKGFPFSEVRRADAEQRLKELAAEVKELRIRSLKADFIPDGPSVEATWMADAETRYGRSVAKFRLRLDFERREDASPDGPRIVRATVTRP